MAIFCLKKIDKPLRIGTILRKKRKEEKMTLDQAANFSHIPKEYLLAIEKNRYNSLPPAKAHSLAYVRKYATILKLNTDQVVKQFIEESDLENYTTIHPFCKLKIRPINSIVIWAKRFAICASLVLFVGYLVWQVNGILKPPKLLVYSPQDGFISDNMQTNITGATEKEAVLQINGKGISINDKGLFDTTINLSKGINTITITAAKKHGKTTTITRYVILKENFAKKADKLSFNKQ